MNSQNKRAASTNGPQVPSGWNQQGGIEAGHQLVAVLFRVAIAHPMYDGNEFAWDPILELLNLPLCYQPAIAQVLSEGRWRGKQNPKAYVATAAYRQGLRMKLKQFKDPGFKRVAGSRSPMDCDCDHSIDPPADRWGDERISDGDGIDYHEGSGQRRNGKGHGLPIFGTNDFDRTHIPKWLQHQEEPDRIDWSIVAKYAALKPSMVPALALTLDLRIHENLSRDEAVRATGRQKELEASWKWIDRNWETRIVPVLRMKHCPIADLAPQNQSRKSFIPPWEALRGTNKQPNGDHGVRGTAREKC